MAKRSPKRVVEARVTRIVALMSRGASNRELREYMKSEWGLSNTQSHRYIGKANEAIMDECNQDRRLYASKMINALQLIQQKSFRDGDLKTAIAAISQLCRVTQITS